MNYKDAVKTMCERCKLHCNICMGTGCAPRTMLTEIAEKEDAKNAEAETESDTAN